MSTERKITAFPQYSPYHPETAENIMRGFAPVAGDAAWLATLRGHGAEYVRARGLPTPKLEGWKFTNIIPLVREYGATQGNVAISFDPVPGVEVLPLAQSIGKDWVGQALSVEIVTSDFNADQTLAHLANAFLRDGVSVDVAANTHVQEPLHLVVECGGGAFNVAHTVVRVGVNASLTMIEDHRGTGKFWMNGMCHVVLEPGANLTHVRIQEDSTDAVYTQNTNVTVARDASYRSVTLSTGAALSRNQVRVVLAAPGASCHVNAANLMRGKQHTDMTVLVEHLAPHCQSHQNIRTILDDQAHGVFQGKIHVYQPAQKTDGFQMSRALLLSEGAEMNTKPELEIYADDVKCSHGATTGQMDEEPLFYMQSRGIGRDEAKSLLIEAFAAEAFDIVADRPWFDMLSERVIKWLSQ